MNKLFVVAEILNYIEKNNIDSLSRFIDIICTKENIWVEVVCEYLDVFIKYFEKKSN